MIFTKEVQGAIHGWLTIGNPRDHTGSTTECNSRQPQCSQVNFGHYYTDYFSQGCATSATLSLSLYYILLIISINNVYIATELNDFLAVFSFYHYIASCSHSSSQPSSCSVMWSLCLAVSVQLLLCSGWVKPVESQSGIVSQQVRHGLIPLRLESLYGSDMNGSCTLVSGSCNSCNGTSVLNDGEVPVLSGVSNDSESQFATELFTLRRREMARITASFELEDANHDRVELAVFNCPELGISTPEVNVYFDSSFRPGREDRSLGVSNTSVSLTETSCDQLLVFCVKYNSGSSRYINLEFPFPSNNINSTFLFLGEVTFLNGSGAPCPPPKLVTEAPTTIITTDVISTTFPTNSESETQVCVSECTATTLTAGVVSAVITALLVAGISVAIHIAVYQCLYKPRLRSAVAQGGTDQRDDVTGAGGGDAIVYDVVDERVGTALAMKQNEAYGTAKSN